MRVTRLEIFGFKSFMERLTLPLEGGITGVVGPNGCGKSNIVDALRWVLGETRASNLRGEVLEDVIFNGTEKLRPLGLAEVTVTLRSSEKDLFADLISPSVQAEQYAKTVLEASRLEVAVAEDTVVDGEETETAKPHLTVIQGNAGKINVSAGEALSETQPEDAETAAEASGEEEVAAEPPEPAADSALAPDAEAAPGGESPNEEEDATQGFMTRFAWMRSLNEVQITRRLYRSGESEFFINRVQCRLKDVRDFFRAVGLGARSHTIVAQGEVSRIVTARPEDRRLILEEAAGVLGFRDKIASATRRLEDTDVNISRLDDVIKEVSRQVGSLKRAASRARNRQELKDRLAFLDRALHAETFQELAMREQALSRDVQTAKDEEGRRETELRVAQTTEQAARSEMMNVDVQGDALRTSMDNIKEELGRRARERSGMLSRVNELRAFSLSRSTEINRLEERKGTLQTRREECGAEVESLERQDIEISEKIRGVEVGGEDELREISSRLDTQRNEIRRKEQAIREVRDRLIKSQSRLDSINEQLIAASPVNQLRKTIGSSVQEIFPSGTEIKLFVDGLSVPSHLARAVQSVLSERTEYLICDDPHRIGGLFVDKLLKDDNTNRRGLALGVFRTGQAEIGAKIEGIPFVRLLDEIAVAPGFELAARQCFADVYVSEGMEQAARFFGGRDDQSPSLPPGFTVVTHDGDIMTEASFYSLRHDGGVIQVKNRAIELAASCSELKEQHDRMVGERDDFQKVIHGTEAEHAEALRKSRERQARMRELSNQQGNVRGRAQSAKRLLAQVEQDVQKVLSQIAEAHRSIEHFKDEEANVQAQIAALVPDEETRLNEELARLREEWIGLDAQRKEGRDKLNALVQAVESARAGFDSAKASLAKLSLEMQKVDLERGHLRERILSEYGEELYREVSESAATPRLAAEEKAAYIEEQSRIRQRIIREGDVDMSSIQQCEEESARLDDLTKQKEDLEQAAAILKKTIARLTQTSEQRFLATFESVRNNFARLVPSLFGGGKAELNLLDPTRPLESGVEIIAKPPGKKLKTIDLLSGGEKALCATALIFAMFLERPSPLCVLDEVDAPLDEANLVRFLALIREMSMRTQFLMITHNRRSMSTADHLVGVTMQEPGASKVITVSLQEAVSQVA